VGAIEDACEWQLAAGARYYGSKDPAPSLAVKVAKLPARYVTFLAPAKVSIKHLSPAAVKYQFADKICGIALQRTGARRTYSALDLFKSLER
jgi:hypothetical protein